MPAARACVGAQERDADGAGLPHHLVGAPLGGTGDVLADEPVEVDRGVEAAQVEGDGLGLGHLDERLREQVLAVVLLHVVAAAVRVDAAVDTLLGEGTVEHVQDVVPGLDHRDDQRVAERAGVPGLAAALGVEGGAVEDHRRAAIVLASLPHARVELEQP